MRAILGRVSAAVVQRSLVCWIAAALVVGLVAAANEDPEARVRVTSAPPEPLPTVPDLTLPTLTIPEVTLPGITVPKVTLPPVTVPPLPPLPSPVQEVIEQVACVGTGGAVPVTHDGLWLIDADRGCARVVMSGLQPGTPAFSPDGRFAIVPMEDSDEPFSTTTLWKLDLVTGLRKALVPPALGLGQVSWAPDGQWIAYNTFPTDPPLDNPTGKYGPRASSEVWLVRPDGSDAHRVSAIDGWGLLSWSPDSSRLAVALRNDKHLLIVNVRTGAQVRHPVGEIYLASWSPDSRQLVFDAGEFKAEATYLMDAATGSYRLLAQGAHFPRWSPTGSVIGVLRDDHLVLLRPDGSVARDDLGTGMPINWSSDGRYLLSAVGNQDYVLDMQTGAYREIASPGPGPGPWPQVSRFIPGTHTFASIATGARHYTV
jgi:dipeptidyl aminopeptidase/acylaminoacyl peptidase